MERAHDLSAPIVLEREQLALLVTIDDHLAAARAAFLAHAQGRTSLPLPLHIEVPAGGFHAKGAALTLEREWVTVKVNSNFPGNPAHGLPTIQGRVLLFDGNDGSLLAILDSIEITAKRTAAASALAATHLARKDARAIAVLGCGEQGRAQLAALSRVRTLTQATAWDRDEGVAQDFARRMGAQLGLAITPVASVRDATRGADMIVTATSAREPFLRPEDVAPGAFVAAVGADSPHKSELHPTLFQRATVVVDSLAQAEIMGDLHHAVAAGTATRETVHAELADVVSGRKDGRTRDDEITIFDSTGLAIQDAAAAAFAYQRAAAGQSTRA